jgi:DNA-binding response OmpR family regulator
MAALTQTRPGGSSTVRYPSPAVLLIEPHVDTRELYHLWLAQCGFAVTVPLPGHDPAAAARQVSADLVIVEPMSLPDGIGFIGALRRDAACADAVVVVLTTQTSPILRRRAIEAGVDDYVLKPCSIVDLAAAIRAAARRARVSCCLERAPRRSASTGPCAAPAPSRSG